MPRTVICVSRAFGAAGEEVGQIAADRLGYRCLDGEILARAAEKGELDAATVADAEQRRSLARRLLDAMGENVAVAPEAYAYMPAVEIVAGSRAENVRGLIRDAIEEAGAKGDAVIVAHAASHALAGRDGERRIGSGNASPCASISSSTSAWIASGDNVAAALGSSSAAW